MCKNTFCIFPGSYHYQWNKRDSMLGLITIPALRYTTRL